ncbi:DUF3558 domain-containing protein [Streptomyces poriticola]|uniref:DUF3558 domain-containing protein n=1 Tax=Streptomyces poriticola TaxID=3120506 RepID=UPI002FCE4415
MQRKAYVSGAAALLAALLTGCTAGSGEGGPADDSNPGDPDATSAAAEPGRYRTLPEPCRALSHDTLDGLLPGIRQIADREQREKAYEGAPTLTYDTDRKVGCRWKVESADATHHLFVDFERVVSYDTAVSDDDRAETLFAGKELAADLPEPAASTGGSPGGSGPPSGSPSGSPSSSSSPSATSSPGANTSSSPATDASTGPSTGATPTGLQPRTLDGLGDDAFVDDELSTAGTAKRRTVTVAFRTSNVIVTVEYVEQPATAAVEPDSEEMQDRARKLAASLDDSLGG